MGPLAGEGIFGRGVHGGLRRRVRVCSVHAITRCTRCVTRGRRFPAGRRRSNRAGGGKGRA
ncbi:hypothetical protein STRAU_7000 [Streptomyces aurantiacus JA 4570]|uniref:Uncharacterized protein n=1 Tax=Streptomyces aurantiacus JA 4570 TaxID=1286094 RepID=S4AEN4_9ACTN|nr:hypothetical protein STRAU_7000 [Streptomyces aurantiacus JA 4570]